MEKTISWTCQKCNTEVNPKLEICPVCNPKPVSEDEKQKSAKLLLESK